MRHVVRLVAAAVVAALLTTTLALVATPAQARLWTPEADKGTDPTENLNEFEDRVLIKINRVRTRHDLRKVRVFHSCVDRMSERWARHLKRSGTFEHRDQTRVLNRCDLRWTGETLVRGVGLSPRSAVRAWLNSPGHRAVIMKKRARWAGVGARVDGQGRIIGVLNFGDPT
jgi:uncharacterized protein YkwD